MQATNSFMTNQTPKDEGHSTDWANEEIIGQKKPPGFTQDSRGLKHSYSETGNEM